MLNSNFNSINRLPKTWLIMRMRGGAMGGGDREDWQTVAFGFGRQCCWALFNGFGRERERQCFPLLFPLSLSLCGTSKFKYSTDPIRVCVCVFFFCFSNVAIGALNKFHCSLLGARFAKLRCLLLRANPLIERPYWFFFSHCNCGWQPHSPSPTAIWLS